MMRRLTAKRAKLLTFKDAATLGLITLLCVIGIVALQRLGPTESGAPVGEVIGRVSAEGSVELRRAGEFLWHPLSDPGVRERDSIYVDAGARATIDFTDGSRLELGPGTMLRLERIGQKQLNAQVIFGSVTPKRTEKSSVTITRRETALEEPERESRRIAAAEPIPPTPSPEPSPEPPPPPPRPRVKRQAPPRRPATREELLRILSPEGNLVASTGEWFYIEWEPLRNKKAAYEIQLSRSRDFDRFVRQSAGTNNIQIKMPEKGVIYLRIVAKIGDQQQVVSKAHKVTVK